MESGILPSFVYVVLFQWQANQTRKTIKKPNGRMMEVEILTDIDRFVQRLARANKHLG